jgi:uncharacterized lipoprotein YajG
MPNARLFILVALLLSLAGCKEKQNPVKPTVAVSAAT